MNVTTEHELEALRAVCKKAAMWLKNDEGANDDDNIRFVRECLNGALKGAEYKLHLNSWWLSIDGMLVRELTDKEDADVNWGKDQK